MENARSIFVERVGRLNSLQESSFSIIHQGENCLIVAPTGSGKTEAAILPILERISESGEKAGVFALYVTPLRALNRDMMKRLGELCSRLGISVGVRHGDTPQKERRQQAMRPPTLVITTPESIQNMLLSPRLRKSFENLRFVVVDEIHELYHNKRGAQLAVAMERLAELSKGFSRIGISATIGDIDEAARFLFNGKRYSVVESEVEKKLEVRVAMPVFPKRRHGEFEATFQIDDQALARIEYIEDIVKEAKATLVFANTRQVVESLGSKIIYLSRLEGFDYVGIHHSSLDSEERIEIENAFRSGKINCIIATSSLELGIDIGRIDMVVQYGSPRQANRLIQRVGRGGHMEGVVSRGEIVVSGVVEALEAVATVFAAKHGELEKYSMEKLPLDVMANQLSGIVLEYREIEIERAFGILKRTSTYSALDPMLFKRVLDFCSELGLLRVERGKIVLGRRSRNYFIENISVIPDSRRFFVKRASTNRIISTLDEHFVYTNIDENSSFITKGMPWKVISIDNDTIFVEQSDDISAAVPDWEGEDIPVSFNIADKAMLLLSDPSKATGIIDESSFGYILKFCEDQKRFFIPERNSVYIEELDDYLVIYMALGKLANEFLARAIASSLKNRREDFSVRSTPYAIIIGFESVRRRPDVESIMLGIASVTGPESAEVMANSEIFKYKFIHAAKLFGVIEKKAVLTRGRINKLMEFYSSTVVYEEALRDVKKNYVDYGTVSDFLERVRSKEINFSFVGSGSPLSKEILKSALNYTELLSGTDIGNEDVAQVMRKFAGREVEMLCTYCSLIYKRRISIDDLSREKITCGRCKSPMQSTYNQDYFDAVVKRREGMRLSRKESEQYHNAVKEAGLIEAYGDRAVAALLTYGVGISTAGRILKMMRKEDKSFVEDLLRAQRIFIRNSRFWKKRQ